MFRVNSVESDGAEAGADSGKEIGFDALLFFKCFVPNNVCPDASGLGVGWVGDRHSNGWAWAHGCMCGCILRSKVPIGVQDDEVKRAKRVESSKLHLTYVV